MSLKTDIIFVKALRADEGLIAQLPASDVYNTTIALPDEDMLNAPVPYVIVSFDGMQNQVETKDSRFEGCIDNVQIGVEIAAKTRQQLADLAIRIRHQIKSYFENAAPTDDDADLVPIEYTMTSTGVNYDMIKPCYWMTLNYQCETNVDIIEEENDEEENNNE